MILRALAATLCLALLLGGLALPPSTREATLAAMTDAEMGTARLVAEFPLERSCVVFATDPSGSGLFVAGARSTFNGCVVSNADADIVGSRHVFARTLRHAGDLKIAGAGHRITSVRLPEPVLSPRVELAELAPGGTLAQAAGDEYRIHEDGARLDLATLGPGLHYVEGSAKVATGGAFVQATIVALGPIEVVGNGGGIRAHSGGIALASWASADEATGIRILSQGLALEGAVYAASSAVRVGASSASLAMGGPVIGASVIVSGEGHSFGRTEP